jgi:hypothetical protein
MRKLHARVHNIAKRVAQQEVCIDIRVPVECFADVVNHLDEKDVIVLARSDTGVEAVPYGYLDSTDH